MKVTERGYPDLCRFGLGPNLRLAQTNGYMALCPKRLLAAAISSGIQVSE
jgi:hypothetical protein